MSFLTQVYHAAHSDFPDAPTAASPDLKAARAEGFAAENARVAERTATIRADRFISVDPARLAAALALAPTSMSIADIKERVHGVVDRDALAAKVAEMWAPRAEGAADPLAAADQTGKPVADSGWSKVIAKQNAGDGAVASGGPFDPHPSSFAE
jgi:hypothetical protein